jgi:hypothetical protein
MVAAGKFSLRYKNKGGGRELIVARKDFKKIRCELCRQKQIGLVVTEKGDRLCSYCYIARDRILAGKPVSHGAVAK